MNVSGEVFASSQLLVRDMGEEFTRTLRRRAGLEALAGGGAAGPVVDAGGMTSALGYAQQRASGTLANQVFSADLNVPVVPVETAPPPGYGVWAGVFGRASDYDASRGAGEVDNDLYGFAAGVEGSFDWLGGASVVGLAGGYSHGEADVAARFSEADADAWHLGLYGSTALGGLQLAAAVAYASYDLSLEERLGGAGFGLGRADRDADSVSFSGEAAYDIGLGGLGLGEGVVVSPLATLDATWASFDGLQQGGVGGLSLRGSEADYDSVVGGLGGRAGYRGEWFAAEVRAQWRHQFGDEVATQVLRLAGTGAARSVVSPSSGEDWLEVGVGVGASVTPLVSVTARYDGAFGGDFTSHAGSVTVGVKF